MVGGLETGDEVVTYGSFTIDAAAQLNNQASMMNRDVMEKGADHSVHLPDYTESTPIEFKQQLVMVSDAYLLLKDAFVATDNELAVSTAQQVMEAISKVDMSLLKGDAHLYWMEQLTALQAHSKKITELTEVEEQRKQFDFFSQALIKTIEAFGTIGNTFYVQFCPMALNNQGADWLSSEKEIKNPYFGDKMMRCGVVKTTIDKNFKNAPMKQASNIRPQGHNH